MEIVRNGAVPPKAGPEDWFTGKVHIEHPFQANEPGRVSGAVVTFEPGARTAWHTHPLGQTLLVTAGSGRAQTEGGPVTSIEVGDLIWFAPGEKHWHGAGPSASLTHVAIQERLAGEAVEWLHHVSDEEYRG